MPLFQSRKQIEDAEERTRRARYRLSTLIDELHKAIDHYQQETEEIEHARNGSRNNPGRAQ